MAKAKTETVLDLPVQYGNVSIGQTTCRIGVTFDRKALTVSKADKILCGHRLTGTIKASDSEPDQGHLDGMDGVIGEVNSVFDVKSFSATAKAISAGLTFSLEDTDIETLVKFAKRGGQLVVEGVSEIKEEDEDEDEDDFKTDDEK